MTLSSKIRVFLLISCGIIVLRYVLLYFIGEAESEIKKQEVQVKDTILGEEEKVTFNAGKLNWPNHHRFEDMITGKGIMVIQYDPSNIFVHPTPGQAVSIITTVTETNQVWPKPEVIVSNWQKSLTEVPTNLIYRSTW